MGDDLEIWFKSTLAGFVAWRDQDTPAATAHWQQAVACTRQGALRGTPLEAVARNNLLAAAPGIGADVAALSSAWAGVQDRAEREDIPLPARSSVFHLRLASRHADPFSAFLRRRSLMLAGLGLWLGEANALARAGTPEELRAHLRTHDPAQGMLPAFLERAVQIALAGTMDRAAALALLTAQIDHMRSYRATTAMPATLWTQLEACLGFCAFAPIAQGLAQPGGPEDIEELDW